MTAAIRIQAQDPSFIDTMGRGSISAGVSYSTFANATQRNSEPHRILKSSPLDFLEQSNSLEGKLFNAKAAFKIETATIAMHLDRDWREKMFRQIDQLLDADEWDHEDIPVTHQASTTFLRMIVYQRPRRRPGLGATQEGHLVASWTNEGNRLTLICEPMDRVRWIVTLMAEDEVVETASGYTTVARLPIVLAPYNAGQWFRQQGERL